MSLLLFGVMLFCAGFSQTAFHQTVSNPTGTVTNTGVDTMTYTMSGSYTTISIQPLLTKTSGTIAGTSVLQVSVNGINYVSTDTLTNTNVTTNTIIWNKYTAAKSFRILVTGSGTMVGVASAKLSTK